MSTVEFGSSTWILHREMSRCNYNVRAREDVVFSQKNSWSDTDNSDECDYRYQWFDNDTTCNMQPAIKRRRLRKLLRPLAVSKDIITATENTAAHIDSQIISPYDGTTTTAHSSMPYLPETLLGTLVAPFLSDRETFHNFKCSSKDVYMSCRNIPAPWPRKQVQCDTIVQAVTFSPSGDLLVYTSNVDAITLLNLPSGQKTILQAPSKVTSLAFSPNGMYLASGQRPMDHSGPLHEGNIAVCVWDLKQQQEMQRLTDEPHQPQQLHQHHHYCQVLYSYGGANSVAFSPDGELLASGGLDEMVHLWKRQTPPLHPHQNTNNSGIGQQEQEEKRFKHIHALTGMSNWIYHVKFSPNGKYLAAVGEGETAVWLWDMNRLLLLEDGDDDDDDSVALFLLKDELLQHKETIHCVDFTPNGQYLVSGSDDETIRVWDLQSVSHSTSSSSSLSSSLCFRVLEGNQCPVWALACAPTTQKQDGDNNNNEDDREEETVIVSGGRDKDTGERVLRMWSLETGKTIRMLRGHSGFVTSLAFSPSGNTIASGSFERKLMTHRVADHQTMIRNQYYGVKRVNESTRVWS